MSLVAVAFDLGIKNTSYAYSFAGQPISIFRLQHKSMVLSKTSTSLLLDDNGQFHSFGFEAEDKFASLVETYDHLGWRLFKLFANDLQNKTSMFSQSTVADQNGRTHLAMDIFAMAIKYLYNHFKTNICSQRQHIDDDEIIVVFTVHDTWGDLGKKFIKEAAIKAGINAGRLQTVFRSEATVIAYTNDEHTRFLHIPTCKYLVIYQEGSTVLVTVLQSLDSGFTNVVHTEEQEIACCEQFILHTMFNTDVLIELSKTFKNIYSEFIRDLESKTNNIDYILNNGFVIRLPMEFRTFSRIKPHRRSDKIRFQAADFKKSLQEGISSLIYRIKYLAQSWGFQSVFLDGDIVFSSYAKELFTNELGGICVKALCPPYTAMFTGALIKGHSTSIKVRSVAREEKEFLLVAAFDFGTTYSGFGYSKCTDITKVITRIWRANDASACLSTRKTPTSVLLDNKAQFHSFGFTAEDTFAELADKNKHTGWRLFKCFKMILHLNKKLSRKTTIEDVSGQQHEAMPIFVMAIQSLHSCLMETIAEQLINIKETDIRYIITVPAIWDVGAKQFMREAAVQAGICSDRLMLAFESEAAALWCTYSDENIAEPSIDTKHIVIDLGGGTADISVYQRLSDGTVNVLHKASGGAWGSNLVNEQFCHYINKEFGNDVLEKLRKNHLGDYVILTRDFENKKRSHTSVHTALNMRIPLSLVDMAQSRQSQLSLQRDKLRIDPSHIKSWFDIPLKPLIKHLKILLAEDSVKDVQSIILCGGFAESPYVQKRLREKINGIRFIVPDEAGLAVLKGAVLFGHKPLMLASRAMSHTYGISVTRKFDATKHPADKKVLVGGEWKVDNCFSVFVRANQVIPVDHLVRNYFKPLTDISLFKVYRTLSQNPKYTTDAGCELLGKFRINNLTNIPFKDQDYVVNFWFGYTELIVKAKHMTNGIEEMLTLDCLQ